MKTRAIFSRNSPTTKPNNEDIYCEYCGHSDVSEFGETSQSAFTVAQACHCGSRNRNLGASSGLPRAIGYREAGLPTNPYLDTAIEEGWLRVATPLPGDRSEGVDSSARAVEKARFVADAFLNQQSKYPETNNWQDASLVALAVRLFDTNSRIRVITHTADENLAAACARTPPEFGYYDIKSRYCDILPRLKARASHPVSAGQVNPDGWESTVCDRRRWLCHEAVTPTAVTAWR